MVVLKVNLTCVLMFVRKIGEVMGKYLCVSRSYYPCKTSASHTNYLIKKPYYVRLYPEVWHTYAELMNPND